MKNMAVWKELNIGCIANTSTIKKIKVKKIRYLFIMSSE